MDQHDIERCRALLQQALGLTAAGQSLDHIADKGFEGERIAEVLAPMTMPASSVSWLVTNGDRIDAVVKTDQAEWRVVFGSSDRQRFEWINATAQPDRFDGLDRGRIVVLNGPSGAGKSTLMQAIKTVADAPWVVFDEPENVGTVDARYLIWREQAPSLHAGFLEAIVALARAGTTSFSQQPATAKQNSVVALMASRRCGSGCSATDLHWCSENDDPTGGVASQRRRSELTKGGATT